MTPRDTLPLVLDEPQVRVVLVTELGTTTVCGLMRESLALQRIKRLTDRNPGADFRTAPAEEATCPTN